MKPMVPCICITLQFAHSMLMIDMDHVLPVPLLTPCPRPVVESAMMESPYVPDVSAASLCLSMLFLQSHHALPFAHLHLPVDPVSYRYI